MMELAAYLATIVTGGLFIVLMIALWWEKKHPGSDTSGHQGK